MIRHCCFALLLLGSSFAQSQSLALNDFLSRVIKEHPKAKAILQYEALGNANLLRAKGAFDPKIGGTFQRKDLGNINYYGLFNSKIEIPLWPGMDIVGGMERNYGVFLDPSDITTGNLYTAGLRVPLGQGLLYDERRRDVQTARSQQRQLKADQRQLLNKLVFDAVKVYTDWYLSYQKLKLGEENVNLARFRYQNILAQIRLGDLPAMDSLEALLEVQRREVMLKEWQWEFAESVLACNPYIWLENSMIGLDTALKPNISQQPFPLPADSLPRIISRSFISQPILIRQREQIKQLGYEERWNRESLKPMADIIWNPLFSQKYPPGAAMLSENVKWGAAISFPILLRKERGKLSMTRIKTKQENYLLSLAEQENSVQLRMSHTSYIFLDSIIQIQNLSVENQRRLLQLEIQKFNQGESTQFVVNTRERIYIEGRMKLLELEAKRLKSLAELYYVSGDISTFVN